MAKTIYEMAVDYATEDGEGGKPIVIKCEKDAAIFGANYVLGEIESLTKDVSDEYPLFQQGAIIHVRLIKLLEQLKK